MSLFFLSVALIIFQKSLGRLLFFKVPKLFLGGSVEFVNVNV